MTDPIETFVENAAERDTYAPAFEAAFNGDGLTVFASDEMDDQWITSDTMMEIER